MAAASEGKEGKRAIKQRQQGRLEDMRVKTAGVLFTFVYFSLTCVFFRLRDSGTGTGNFQAFIYEADCSSCGGDDAVLQSG